MSEHLNFPPTRELRSPLVFSYEENQALTEEINDTIDNLRFSTLPDKEFHQIRGILLENPTCSGADFSCQIEDDQIKSAAFKLMRPRTTSTENLKLTGDKEAWELSAATGDNRLISHGEVISLFYDGLNRDDFPEELIDSAPDGETIVRSLSAYFTQINSHTIHKRSYLNNDYLVGSDYLYETNTRLEYSVNSSGDSGQLLEVSTPLELNDGDMMRKSYQYFVSSKHNGEEIAGGRVVFNHHDPRLDYLTGDDSTTHALEVMVRALKNLKAEKLPANSR